MILTRTILFVLSFLILYFEVHCICLLCLIIECGNAQERQKVMYEEQRKLVQQQAQTKAQLARYEDELTRKRMQVKFLCVVTSMPLHCAEY